MYRERQYIRQQINPADTQRNNNVIITSSRNDVATSSRRNNDVIITLCVSWERKTKPCTHCKGHAVLKAVALIDDVRVYACNIYVRTSMPDDVRVYACNIYVRTSMPDDVRVYACNIYVRTSMPDDVRVYACNIYVRTSMPDDVRVYACNIYARTSMSIPVPRIYFFSGITCSIENNSDELTSWLHSWCNVMNVINCSAHPFFSNGTCDI